MPQAPIFEGIFGRPLSGLPPVMQKHYGVRADSADRVTVEGVMNIHRGWLIRLMSPFLRLFGALVPYDGKDIPVTVAFYSGPGEMAFHFDRSFHFPGKQVYRFHSRLQPVSGDEVVEVMRGGIGWRCAYEAEGKHIRLHHRGYVWRIGRFLIPLPLALILGKGAAGEEVLTDDTFSMWMTITHPLFGENYRYEGTFKIAGVTLG